MTNYHIAKNGLPSVCDAEPGGCPLKTEHFTNKMAAVRGAERILEEELGAMPSQKRKLIFHIGESGAVEVCENQASCTVKPFGIYNPSHSENSDRLLGAAQAYRESVGRIDADDALKNTQKQSTPPLRTPPPVATDANTMAARELLGGQKAVPRKYNPELGDYVIASRTDPDTGEEINTSFRVDDPAGAHKKIQELVDNGFHPSQINVRTAMSCHHSVVPLLAKDYKNVVEVPKAGDTRMLNGELQFYDVGAAQCWGEKVQSVWKPVKGVDGSKMVVDGRTMQYTMDDNGLTGKWMDAGEAQPVSRLKNDPPPRQPVSKTLSSDNSGKWDRGQGFRI